MCGRRAVAERISVWVSDSKVADDRPRCIGAQLQDVQLWCDEERKDDRRSRIPDKDEPSHGGRQQLPVESHRGAELEQRTGRS